MYMYIQASQRWKENAADLSKTKVSAQLSALNAAAARLVALSMDSEIDTSRIEAAMGQM